MFFQNNTTELFINTLTWINQIHREELKFENLPNIFLSLGLSTALEFETEKYNSE